MILLNGRLKFKDAILLLLVSFARNAISFLQSPCKTCDGILFHKYHRHLPKICLGTYCQEQKHTALYSTIVNDQDLEKEIFESLVKNCGVCENDTIVTLCSGGVDSLALLRGLAEVRKKFMQLNLFAITFDHCLRNESAAEVAFVKAQCESVNVECYVRHWTNSKSWKGIETRGIQQLARDWRLSESQTLLKSLVGTQMRPGFIATAHHLGDQEETTLLKLTRGVHLSRLRGMDYFSTLNVNGGECVTVIRPLLGLRKDCFKEYLNCSGIRWVEDPSNTATKYSRNKIRLEVLPALRHVAGGEEALASRLQELERQSRMLAVMLHRISIDWENQHLTSSIAHSFPLTLWLDESLSELVQEELLYRFICKNAENLLKRKENNESNFSIGSSQISRIANLARNNCGNWEVSIGHKLIARNHKGMLKLHFEGENTNDNSMDFSSSCTKTASNVTISAPDYWKVTILYTNEPEEEGMVLFNIPPNSEITLRFRYPGDRFKPHWKGHGIKLKDFLRGQKVPFRERDNVVLAVLNREDTDAEKCSIIGVYPGYASTDHVKDATGFQPIKLRVIGAGENAIYKVSDTCTKKANVSSLFDDK